MVYDISVEMTCNGDVNDPVEAVANEAKTARKHVTNPPQGPQKSH